MKANDPRISVSNFLRLRVCRMRRESLVNARLYFLGNGYHWIDFIGSAVMSEQQEAAQSELNKLDFEWGWKRAAHEYTTRGHFEPAHFPEGTAAYRGYEAFAKMIRDKRRAA